MEYFYIFVSVIQNQYIMNISSDTPVGEVVKLNFKTAPLFQANNIDYCCGGSKTISQACAEAGIDSEQLIRQLQKTAVQSDPDTEYINSLTPAGLCDYIIGTHHSYVRSHIPFLQKNIEKVCRAHGVNHPEFFEIQQLFEESAGDLTMHMQKEELMLFPYIQKMVKVQEGHSTAGKPAFGTVSNPIAVMIAEHQTEGDRFDKIAALTKNYAIPEDACTTYEVTLLQLKEFESDLHRHIHLENNILFPKAIELEAELARKYFPVR